MLFAGSYATGSAGTGFASPANVGVPGSTAGGMPGTYSAYASAPPPSSTVAEAAITARRRRASNLLAPTPILEPLSPWCRQLGSGRMLALTRRDGKRVRPVPRGGGSTPLVDTALAFTTRRLTFVRALAAAVRQMPEGARRCAASAHGGV